MKPTTILIVAAFVWAALFAPWYVALALLLMALRLVWMDRQES